MNNWEKEFDKKFNCDSPNGKAIVLIYENTQEPAQNIIKQFIKDLRKKDEEKLIKMLPIENDYFQEDVIKLIKDYYKK